MSSTGTFSCSRFTIARSRCSSFFSTLTRSDGKAGTRGYLKLRPEAGARLLEQISKASTSAPVVDLGDVRSQILAALKSVNLRAAKGEALPENVYAKVQSAMATTSAAITKLRNAIKVADLASARKLEEQIAYLERWNGGLQQVVRVQVPKPVLGGEQFHSDKIPTQLTYKLKAAPAASAGPKWQRSTSLQYETAKFDKGAAIEGKGVHASTDNPALIVTRDGTADDALAGVARPGDLVVTADRGLRERVTAVGAQVIGPSWLLDLIDGLGSA